MKSQHVWKLLFVILIVSWAVSEMRPPVGKNLIEHFEATATAKDETFNQILAEAKALQEKNDSRTFANLFDAVGTNDIAKYFPSINVEGETDKRRKVLQKLQKESSGQIKLGIDLQGGTYFVVGMDMDKVNEDIAKLTEELNTATNETQRAEVEGLIDAKKNSEQMVTQAIEVLRKRVDGLGVAEPIIVPQGTDRIVIQLPGLSEEDREQARMNIQKAAFLEFRLVHQNSPSILAEGIIPPGWETVQQIQEKDDRKFVNEYVVRDRPERGMTGKYVKSAMVSRNPMTGLPQINMNLDGEGASLFADITTDNVNRQLAIILDGILYSAPNINEPITTGTCQISGDYDVKEAMSLANALENPLEAPVMILEERSTDPSLGAASIAAGFKATVFGFGAVIIFMLVYYLASGFVANIALLLNLVVLLGVFCSIDATLTLPGIAGILLTVGMAVDANVLIFERIREEANAGKSLKGSIKAGYDKAFSTIFDANLTTLIASVILINLGTGPVKGFGYTLTIGIAVSMFTALFVTRLIFEIMVDKGIIKKISMLQLGFLHNKTFDFISKAKPAFIASWLLVAIGIGYGAMRGGDVMGVDFKGGDSITFSFNEKVDSDELSKTVADLGFGTPQVQYQKSMLDDNESLQVLTAHGKGEEVSDALISAYPSAGFSQVGKEGIGPAIGSEILRSAFVAVLLALFGILVYVAFRYEFSFAIAAVIATLHDLFMTMGWFFLTGRELSAPMVAALLTIIGFSINDTIVIFDRIREDLNMGAKGSFKDIINRALNKTLARTIITSGTTFLSTAALYLFGGGVINDFAFTFLVGILTGTYSSIFIAAAIVLWWNKGEKPKTAEHAFNETIVIQEA